MSLICPSRLIFKLECSAINESVDVSRLRVCLQEDLSSFIAVSVSLNFWDALDISPFILSSFDSAKF